MLNKKFAFLSASVSVTVSSVQISLHELDCQLQSLDKSHFFHLFLQFCTHQRSLAIMEEYKNESKTLSKLLLTHKKYQ